MANQNDTHAQCVPHHDLLAATVSCKGYDITISCDDYDIRDHLMDWLSGCRTPAGCSRQITLTHDHIFNGIRIDAGTYEIRRVDAPEDAGF